MSALSPADDFNSTLLTAQANTIRRLEEAIRQATDPVQFYKLTAILLRTRTVNAKSVHSSEHQEAPPPDQPATRPILRRTQAQVGPSQPATPASAQPRAPISQRSPGHKEHSSRDIERSFTPSPQTATRVAMNQRALGVDHPQPTKARRPSLNAGRQTAASVLQIAARASPHALSSQHTVAEIRPE